MVEVDFWAICLAVSLVSYYLFFFLCEYFSYIFINFFFSTRANQSINLSVKPGLYGTPITQNPKWELLTFAEWEHIHSQEGVFVFWVMSGSGSRFEMICTN